MTKINATVVADSKNLQGDRLTTMMITFPRFILAELNTHRMLSKNSASSRAIPFNKMVEAVKNNPFIPIAWQKEHKGMQGSEYFLQNDVIDWANMSGNISAQKGLTELWLEASVLAIDCARGLHKAGLTKQLCNRLLEPFMWHTVLISGTEWENFFALRCPQYGNNEHGFYKSKKDALRGLQSKGVDITHLLKSTDLEWLFVNQGQAEIHMMALAECMWDAMNESIPKELKAGEWHIPFRNKIDTTGDFNKQLQSYFKEANQGSVQQKTTFTNPNTYHNILQKLLVKVSTAMCARTSYTIIGEEKEFSYEKQIELHDRMANQVPFHASPFEHCARAMTDEEYTSFIKGKVPQFKDDWGIGVHERYFVRTKKMFEEDLSNFTPYNKETTYLHGWCRNFKGFIQYRELLENKKV